MEQQETLVANTTESASINTPVEKPRHPKNIQSEETYTRLREGIRNKFKSLIEEQRPIFHGKQSFNNGFEEFLAHITLEDKNHFNCNCCKAFFKEASTLAYMDDSYKAVNILNQVFNEVFEAAAGIAELKEFPIVGNSDANRTMNAEVYTETKNDWNHFFAFTEDEAKAINDRGNVDPHFTESFFQIVNGINMDRLKTIIPYLDQALFVPKSVGLLKPLAHLLESYKANKNAMQLSLYTVIALLSREPKTNWLKGLRSSSAGNVLDYLAETETFKQYGETIEEARSNGLKRLVNSINEQTDPIRYRRAVAEASEQQLKLSVDKLIELNVPRLLERKLMSVDELETVWSKKDEVIDAGAPDQELSAVERALKARLKDSNKVLKKETGEDLKSLIGLNPIEKSISLTKFLEKLPEFTRIRYMTPKAMVLCFTKPVDDTDYSEVLYNTPNGVLARFIYNPVPVIEHMDGARGYEITEIKRHERKGDVIHCFQIPELKPTFDNILTDTGTCVLGDDLDPKFKDHIRGWTELSKEMTMGEAEGEAFTGSRIVVGSTFMVIDKNGVAFKYNIATAE